MPTRRPRPARLAGTAAAAALTAAALAGCSWLGGGGQPADPTATASTSAQAERSDEENQAIADDVEAAIGQLAGVTSAKVYYTNDFTTPATAAVDVVVATGSDYDPIFDEVTRLLWQSRLSPITTMSISGVDAGGNPELSQSRRYGFLSDAQIAAFDANYGPRPG